MTFGRASQWGHHLGFYTDLTIYLIQCKQTTRGHSQLASNDFCKTSGPYLTLYQKSKTLHQVHNCYDFLSLKSKLPTAIADAIMKTMPFQKSCVPNFLVCSLAYPIVTESKFYLFFQLFGVEPRTDISIIELYSK